MVEGKVNKSVHGSRSNKIHRSRSMSSCLTKTVFSWRKNSHFKCDGHQIKAPLTVVATRLVIPLMVVATLHIGSARITVNAPPQQACATCSRQYLNLFPPKQWWNSFLQMLCNCGLHGTKAIEATEERFVMHWSNAGMLWWWTLVWSSVDYSFMLVPFLYLSQSRL